MSLPSSWVENIFTKLTLIYGRKFLDQWAGIDIEAVKEDWAHELSGLAQSPAALSYALQNLPEGKPPTVLEFRATCRRMPGEVFQALPQQRIDPAIAAEFARVAKAKVRPSGGGFGNKDWAHRLIATHAAGGNVRPYSLKLAQAAIAPRSLAQ